MKISDIPTVIREEFQSGTVIPAMPLALTKDRIFDPDHQQAVLRYYIDAGVGGIAVGVHSTQFGIRDPAINLIKPVLSFASEKIDQWCSYRGKKILKIAGICGKTSQAINEAEKACQLGYYAGLLSLSALNGETTETLLKHCREIAARIPIIGFYLQPAVGGAILPYSFWREFSEIENVLAIKIAAFNRYQTLEVIRAIADSGKEQEITLYTGNDDNIVVDLLTPFIFNTSRGQVKLKFNGGLLGHWGVWTHSAVKLYKEIKQLQNDSKEIPISTLTKAMEVTDMNGALFDSANAYAGCIPGIHDVLRRNKIFAGNWCLNPNEKLSPGQEKEIDRVIESYPHLCDQTFIKEHLDEWLKSDFKI